MTTKMFKKYTESLTREWEVGANVPGGTVVIDSASGQVGITLTPSGGSTRTTELPDGSTLTHAVSGLGNRANSAVVAVDGSWRLPVTGVTDGETVPNSAPGSNRGTKVYAIVAAGKVTGHTLTATDNTYIGIIDDGTIVDGVAPVQIGVPA